MPHVPLPRALLASALVAAAGPARLPAGSRPSERPAEPGAAERISIRPSSSGGRPRLDAPYVATDLEVVDAMLAPRPGPARRLCHRSRLGRRPHPDRRRAQPRRARPRRRHRSGADPRGERQCPRRRRRRPGRLPPRRICSRPRSARPTCSPSISPRRSTCACARASSRRCAPGTRVVSHDFDMGDWRPDQRRRVGTANVYLWIVPARIEGRWTLTDGGRTRAARRSTSNIQDFTGTAAASGGSVRIEQGMLTGAQSASSPISAAAAAPSRAGSRATRSSPADPRAGWRMARVRLMPLRRSPAWSLAWAVMLLFGGMELDRGLLLYLLCRRSPRLRRAPRGSSPSSAAPRLLLAVTLLGLAVLLRPPRHGSAALLLGVITLSGRLLVELQKDWIGTAPPRGSAASRRRPVLRLPERPCRQRHARLALPRLAAAARAPRARALAVWARGLAGAAGRAQPGRCSASTGRAT